MEGARDMVVVLDTNTVLRALANRQSASAAVVRLCEEHRVQLALSRSILAEYREVLTSPGIVERHGLDANAVELVLRRLRYHAQYVSRPSIRFRFDRDPRDAKFLELSIAVRATHLITHDLDLLSLTSARTLSAIQFRRRLPTIHIVRAQAFLDVWRARSN